MKEANADWSGKWSSGSTEVTISGSGDSLTATEEWKNGERHGTGTWSNCKVNGNTAKCDWTGTYEGDPDKSGNRKGTLGVTLSGETITGSYYEDEPDFSWRVSPYPSAMHKGAVWPINWTRKK